MVAGSIACEILLWFLFISFVISSRLSCFLLPLLLYIVCQINHIESVGFMLLNFFLFIIFSPSSRFFYTILKNITLTVLFFTYNSDLNYTIFGVNRVYCCICYFIWYDWAKHGKFHCERFQMRFSSSFFSIVFFCLVFNIIYVHFCSASYIKKRKLSAFGTTWINWGKNIKWKELSHQLKFNLMKSKGKP